MPVVADTKPGDMVHTVANDCGEIEAYLSEDLLPSVSTAVQLVGLIAVMLYLDWRLALVGLVVLLLAMGVVRYGGRAAEVSRLRLSTGQRARLHETLAASGRPSCSGPNATRRAGLRTGTNGT